MISVAFGSEQGNFGLDNHLRKHDSLRSVLFVSRAKRGKYSADSAGEICFWFGRVRIEDVENIFYYVTSH